MEHLQHLGAVIGASVAALASLFQGRRAKKKSMKSRKHHDELSEQVEDWTTLKSILISDIEHFRKVGVLWYVFLCGAIIAVLAEGFDWWGSAHNWW